MGKILIDLMNRGSKYKRMIVRNQKEKAWVRSIKPLATFRRNTFMLVENLKNKLGEIALSTTALKSEAVEAWQLLQKVYQTIYRGLQKDFYNKGITTAQFEVLMELTRHRELPMWKIGDLLSVTGGNVTGLIDRLEKKGLVIRKRSDKDRRMIMARITPQGDKVFGKVRGEFEQKLEETLSALGNGDLGKFNSILDKLYRELKNE